MQLSKFTDYTFRTLIYLGKNDEEMATVSILAKELEISEHHLKKIVNNLSRNSYIISTKGRNGGLKLGLTPEKINLGEIIKITEENLNIVQCMNSPKLCPLMNDGCKLKNIINNSLQVFLDELGKYTLKDIL